MEHVSPHYKLAVTIVNQDIGTKVANAARGVGALYSTVVKARGTAKSKVLRLLHLDNWEREVVLSFVPQGCIQDMMRAVDEKVHLSKPGHGVAFVLGVNKVTSAVAKRLKTDPNPNTTLEREEPQVKAQKQHELIISIVNHGFADAVVSAARKAGAHGVTVIHGFGNGIDQAIKFFDISVEQDIDLVLTLIDKDKTQVVLDTIVKDPECIAGKVLAFVLEVEQAAGLHASHD